MPVFKVHYCYVEEETLEKCLNRLTDKTWDVHTIMGSDERGYTVILRQKNAK
jgi:hypothetical protein